MSRRKRTRAPARAAKELSLHTGPEDDPRDDEPEQDEPDTRTPIGPLDCAPSYMAWDDLNAPWSLPT